jgi:hypothetical protein
VLADPGGALDLGVCSKGADGEALAFYDNPFEGQGAEVDQDLRRREAHIEGGNEALPAGKHARPLAMALEQIECFAQATRLRVGKRGRLQALLLRDRLCREFAPVGR